MLQMISPNPPSRRDATSMPSSTTSPPFTPGYLFRGEKKHERFLAAMERCRTPGTREYQRILAGLTLIERHVNGHEEQEPVEHKKVTRSGHSRFRTLQHYINEVVGLGEEFTSRTAAAWMRSQFAPRLQPSLCDVVMLLKSNSKMLGIRVINREPNGKSLQIWRVVGQ